MGAVSAEAAAAALVESWGHLGAAVSDGWTRAERGAVAAVTGVALPTLNGVWVTVADAQSEVVAGLLNEVAATGLPYCLQARPGGAEQLTSQAAARGMTREDDIPLMVLEEPREIGRDRVADELLIRELPASEASAHARLAAAGFESPAEPFLQLMTPSVLAAPGVRCYLGEVDGQPVTTGVGLTLGSYVGIFNIATPPACRRRGYGAAVTARAVADGVAAGAKWAWLQSSPAGYQVYQRLGFRTTENWRCWLSTIAHSD
jgi:ribosomal protein S18 acetylase RimI-like enzyme